MNLSSVILGANSPRFVNSQLVCLLPVGILNRKREGGGGGILKEYEKPPKNGRGKRWNPGPAKIRYAVSGWKKKK